MYFCLQCWLLLIVTLSNAKKYNFNSEWRLQIGDFPEAKQSQFDDSRWKAVTLPHAFNEDEAFKVSIEQHDGHSGMVSETLSDSGFR